MVSDIQTPFCTTYKKINESYKKNGLFFVACVEDNQKGDPHLVENNDNINNLDYNLQAF